MKKTLLIILTLLIWGCDPSPTIVGNLKTPFVVVAIEKVDDDNNLYLSKNGSSTNETVYNRLVAPRGFNIGDTLIVIKKEPVFVKKRKK